MAHLRVRFVRGRQLRVRLERAVDGHVQRVRDEPGHTVSLAVRHSERAAHVPNRGLRAERPERDDLRDAVVTIPVRRPADDLVAPVVGEVEIDIGRLAPLMMEEALEHQPRGDGVDLRDAQAVEDRGRRRAPPHAHRDALRAREVRDLPHDVDVVHESSLADDLQLPGDALAHFIGRVRISAGHPLVRQLLQVLLRRHARRAVRLGEVQPVEVQAQVALLCDAPGVLDGLGQVREEGAHLLLALHVVRVVGHAHPVLFVNRRVGPDAQEDVVDLVVFAEGVMAVVSHDQGKVEFLRQPEEKGIGPALVFHRRVILDFDVVAVEDLAAPAREGDRVLPPAVQQASVQLARRAPRERDDALAVPFEELPVHPGFVVVAFEVRLRDQGDEVLVAALVLRQQRQVVGRLLPRVTGVPRAGRHVRLDADDGLDAARLRFQVEVDGPVERPVIRQGHRLLPQLADAVHELRNAREAVEQAVFGMKV